MVFRSDRALVAFRIGYKEYPLLDGTGAAASETARWNSRGRYIIYATEHYANALLEIAAQAFALRFPPTLVYTRITTPPRVSVEEVRADDLSGWDAEHKSVSQRFGDRWYDERRSLILIVPSLAAPGIERNILINQRHAEFTGVTAGPAAPICCHPKLLAGTSGSLRSQASGRKFMVSSSTTC